MQTSREVGSSLLFAGESRFTACTCRTEEAWRASSTRPKLAWLAELRAHLEATSEPSDQVAVCGDFNVAPEDRDVWDPTATAGQTHVTEPERRALADLTDWGLTDVFRMHRNEDGLFSWWDYRAGCFHKHEGMRIDLILLSKVLAERSTFVLVDRNARKGKLPSDHAPVFVDLD